MEQYTLAIQEIQQIIEWFSEKKITEHRIKEYFNIKRGKLTGE